MAQALKHHTEAFPPSEVTLPWLRPNGSLVTKRLLFTRLDGAGTIRRTDFNTRAWKSALVAVIPAPEPGPTVTRQPASTA
uniref:hypothetical protein n=1 Tax=Streptomyces kebangsaanensis TaxID=864058 RepID=UPI00389A7851